LFGTLGARHPVAERRLVSQDLAPRVRVAGPKKLCMWEERDLKDKTYVVYEYVYNLVVTASEVGQYLHPLPRTGRRSGRKSDYVGMFIGVLLALRFSMDIRELVRRAM
jgi:hypothetical protein